MRPSSIRMMRWANGIIRGSCATTSTPEEIAFTLYLTIPNTPMVLTGGNGSSTFERVLAPVTNFGELTDVAPKGETGAAGILMAQGPDGIPALLYVDYGAKAESTIQSGPPELVTPRGCWLYVVAL